MLRLSRLWMHGTVAVLLVIPVGASGQEAATHAAAAEKNRAALQKELAQGSDLDKRLRLDRFAAGDNAVKVVGVFLDSLPETNDDPLPFDRITEVLTQRLQDKLQVANLKLDMTGVVRLAPDRHPHVLLQAAANAAASKGTAAADQVLFRSSAFDDTGALVIQGVHAKTGNPLAWLEKAQPSPLAKNPAATRPDGTAAPVKYNLQAVEWKIAPTQLQKLLAQSDPSDGSADDKARLALRRLFVERTYFFYQVNQEPNGVRASLRFRVHGLRLGEAELRAELVQDAINPLVTETAGRAVPGDYAPLLTTVIAEPTQQLRAAVAAQPALDGVRLDPGFHFGPNGELMAAGIHPGFTTPAQNELLTTVIQTQFAAFGKGKARAAEYQQLAQFPVSTQNMIKLPITKLMQQLRTWAIESKDDLRLLRLYFPANAEAVQKQYFVASEGLVLLYHPASAADIKDVETQFTALVKRHLDRGIPPPPDGPAQEFPPTADKRPLLPGLTAYLRQHMTTDPKKWYGVLIERGYFDAENRYSLRGVVDAAHQNTELAQLLKSLQEETKWAEYFHPPPAPPALDVVPMNEMLERIRRVTPAYATFDGIRILSARYDENANLIFTAKMVGQPDAGASTRLAQLIRDHAVYKRRAPAGRLVRIERDAATSTDAPIPDFNLLLGGKLLAQANNSPEDLQKAKDWLEVATLHYPNEAAVWFLSAYYHYAIAKDDELTRRDLYRVVELEGPLAFDGTAQRKRRYEAAKDLQGATRAKFEELWLECFREVKDGAKPITLTPKTK
ncbi:MAG: hypothetical protein RMJ56_12035 [Gemmataceae bacterium]|nr:hypothetical protein [Gemmata sp.]MDW8198321.1 hypothetical protein [Gemmataceae bacterium]